MAATSQLSVKLVIPKMAPLAIPMGPTLPSVERMPTGNTAALSVKVSVTT